MAANSTLNEYTKMEARAIEDAKIMSSATNILKQEFVSYYPNEVPDEKEISQCIEKIFNMTNMSIKMYSKTYYKKTVSLDLMELEQIKNALENYKNDNERVNKFKKEIINNLSSFQKEIRNKHLERIAELRKEYQVAKKELNVLNFEKHKLIMERLSKILWPYDNKTKQYDAKISNCEIKLKRYAQRLTEMETTRPHAQEKDIIFYQMQLKEKYGQKKV